MEMTVTDWIQAISMVVLVIITGIYVWRTFAISNATKKQADASIKMAEEMREQRYDAVRPVIDIQRQARGAQLATEAYAAIHEETSHGLSCILCNVGVGPAIDVYSFIQHPEGEHRHYDFGTLATGGKTERMNFSLKHGNNRMALVAYYKDVYGRAFESSRKVRPDKEKHGWEVGPLKTRPVKEDELP